MNNRINIEKNKIVGGNGVNSTNMLKRFLNLLGKLLSDATSKKLGNQRRVRKAILIRIKNWGPLFSK